MFNEILETGKSLLTGAVVGAVFALLRLPVPAPQVLAGVAGVVGLWVGFMLVSHFAGGSKP